MFASMDEKSKKDYFKKELQKHIKTKGDALKFIILNAEAINYIDSSAVHMLRQVIAGLRKKNIQFLIAGSIGPTRDILYSSGLIDDIGKGNLFVRTNDAFEHCISFRKKTDMEETVSLQSKNVVM